MDFATRVPARANDSLETSNANQPDPTPGAMDGATNAARGFNCGGCDGEATRERFWGVAIGFSRTIFMKSNWIAEKGGPRRQKALPILPAEMRRGNSESKYAIKISCIRRFSTDHAEKYRQQSYDKNVVFAGWPPFWRMRQEPRVRSGASSAAAVQSECSLAGTGRRYPKKPCCRMTSATSLGTWSLHEGSPALICAMTSREKIVRYSGL